MPPPFPTPSPRPAVADALLQRPDWTAGQPRDAGALWLDKNENGDPAMAALVARLTAEAAAEAVARYPDLAALYAKLARHLRLPPDRLLLAAGSDGAIRAAFEAYVAPGDAVVITEPTFAMYAVYARMYGARLLPLAYRPSNAGPALGAAAVIEAIAGANPKLVCLPNPDSPTGTVFPPGELRAVVEAAGRSGALMLIDEAYHPFWPETALPWVEDYPHLVVTRSTGKAWGMAGLRIGYAAASPAVARALHKVRPMYEVGALSAAVFLRLLDHADAMADSVARLEAGKRRFLAAMEGLGFRTLRGHGNFLHVSFGAKAAAVHAALAGHVTYRRDFAEPCLAGFSRFSATTEERFASVIQRIEAVA